MQNPLSKEDYEKQSIELTTDHYKSVIEFGGKYQKILKSGVIDAELSEWFTNQANELIRLGEDVKALVPPEEYKDVDQHFKEAMQIFNGYFEAFIKGLETQDLTIINEHIPSLQKAQDLCNYARAVISIDYDYPVLSGDGTLKTSDLKMLDSNIGKDIDSVLLNVSKDGKELVGKWGFYNDDGTFNVSAIFHEDGSYEGYGNGTYPSKDNYFEGSWEYDYLTQTLNIHHTDGYSDGKN